MLELRFGTTILLYLLFLYFWEIRGYLKKTFEIKKKIHVHMYTESLGFS